MEQQSGLCYKPKGSYSNNILSSIRMNAAKNPDLPAFICEDRSLSWSEMWIQTNRLANGLTGLGLKPGDRLAIYLKNCIEFSETCVAGYKNGLIRSPVSSFFKTEELIYQLNDCGAVAIVTSPELLPIVKDAQPRVPDLKHIIVTGEYAPGGVISYDALVRSSSPDDTGYSPAPQDMDVILYTSGTTGKPKGAIRGIMENYHTGITVCIDWRIRSGDVQLVATPQYHAGAMAWSMATAVSGGTLVILSGFDPVKLLATIEKHKVNWLMMVPIMYEFVISLPAEILKKYDLSSLRTIISGGAPLHTHTKLKIKDLFTNAELNEFYGSTELGVSTCLRDVDQLRKIRCVGKPGHDLELKLFDLNGTEVKQGENGILFSRGLGGFRGYWNNEKATAEAFLGDDWATVGDIARQDEEGYYYIVDRLKDMIITGGVNVYPVEIEGVLVQMEGVKDAAVIGVPDKQWGEAIKAIVVKTPESDVTEGSVIEYCHEKLAKYKVPKSVSFVDSIPRTLTGKILKKDLRKEYWGEKDIQVS
jgi:long-chain acyl-CoA synthetase